ncbi:MAG: hypothetical protein Q8M01_16485 [Rubrivivax sp.]|nr:hypothetical protein [Rubrivivax sp.]
MRTTLRWAAALLLLALAAAALALAAALQRKPVVAVHEEVGAEDAARVMALLRAHDPRYATPGRLRVVSMNEGELEVLLNHGARRWLAASSQVSLRRGAATVTMSGRAPANPFGRWVNVELRLVQTGALPAIESMRIGRLPIPVWLGEWLGLRWIERAGLLSELQLPADVIRDVRFMPQHLQVVYAWRSDSTQRVLEALLPAAEQQRLRVYAERLAELSHGLKPAWEVPLAQLVGPLFTLAQARTAAGGDAAAENRAAIVVLTLFANGRGLPSVLPAAQAWPRARPLRLLLAGRDDFPRHFLVSAALVVETTGALALAIGLAKEVADARSGSGFSFNDMAANRAGTRFGELALHAPARLQALLAPGVTDDDLMPAWADLPEFLPEAEFVRRYGGVGAAPYEAVMAEIERRVDALRLFR